MFNFKDELSRYQPLLELDAIEHSLQPSQLKDLVDILDHIAQNSGNLSEMDTKEG